MIKFGCEVSDSRRLRVKFSTEKVLGVSTSNTFLAQNFSGNSRLFVKFPAVAEDAATVIIFCDGVDDNTPFTVRFVSESISPEYASPFKV